MVLGVIVVLVVGVLIYRYFTGLSDENVDVPAVSTEQTEGVEYDEEGREIYIVVAGDSLWNIAQEKLDDGYDWVKIAALNNIVGNYELNEGQRIVLPTREPGTPRLALGENRNSENGETEEVSEPESNNEQVTTSEPEATPEPTIEPTIEPTTQPTAEPEPTQEEQVSETESNGQTDEGIEITGDKYVVVAGDSLWTIAIRAYGDGYKWVDIAKANELANPDIIHAGNEFTLPR